MISGKESQQFLDLSYNTKTPFISSLVVESESSLSADLQSERLIVLSTCCCQ